MNRGQSRVCVCSSRGGGSGGSPRLQDGIAAKQAGSAGLKAGLKRLDARSPGQVTRRRPIVWSGQAIGREIDGRWAPRASSDDLACTAASCSVAPNKLIKEVPCGTRPWTAQRRFRCAEIGNRAETWVRGAGSCDRRSPDQQQCRVRWRRRRLRPISTPCTAEGRRNCHRYAIEISRDRARASNSSCARQATS